VISYSKIEKNFLGKKDNKIYLNFPKVFSLTSKGGKVTKGGRKSIPYLG